MFNKFIAGGIIALSFLLTGCGEKDSTAATENAATAPAQSQESQKDEEKTTVKIAYLPITHALPAFELAEIEKLKKDTNLNVELVKFGSWTELVDALNTGRVDAAFALVELVMKAREQGIDVYLAALGHKDGNVIVVNNDITSMKDLRGKTFAIPHRQSSHYILLNDALAKENIEISEINIVELAPPEMPAALASGQIAGYCVAEPFGAKAVSLKIGKVLYNSNELWPDSICCGLALSGKFLSSHPELAKLLVAGIRKAGLALDENHDHARETASKYLSVTKDALDVSLKWISFKDLTISKEHFELLREKVKKYGLSENPVSYEDIVRNVD